MATLGLSKVFILDKYFTELQKFWETEKKLQDASSSNEAVHLQRRLLSLSSELVTLRNHLHEAAPPAPRPRAPHPDPHHAPAPHHTEPRRTPAPPAPPAPPPAPAAPAPPPAPAPAPSPAPADLEDLIHLRGPLTEDAVVRALQARFYQNKFYTWIGPIVVSVNGYTDTGNSLTLSAARAVRPDLARLVHAAVRHQADTGYPQAIILSGVSGSGKTYLSMVVLRRLFDVAGGGGETDAFKHLAAAFTVLRALGTAATRANRHSSRVGHFIEAQLSDAALYRTKIHCYFLDQGRVARPPPHERNYHIFYQMLAGLTPEERSQLHLEGYTAQDLRYLASPQPRRPDPEDAARFHAWKQCLGILGIPFLDVVRVLAAVLLLGNVQFEEGEEGGVLAAAAALLGLTRGNLLRALAARCRRGARVPAVPATAAAARDALARALYARTVATIVRRANSLRRPGSTLGTLSSDSAESRCGRGGGGGGGGGGRVGGGGGGGGGGARAALAHAVRATDGFVGILDMFGFEQLAPSRLEQLCANLCAETMQHFYNTHVFKSSAESCREEGVVCPLEVEYVDNVPCIDLVSSLRGGLLAALDAECAAGGGPEGYVTRIRAAHAGHARLAPPRHPHPRRFRVRHYAGEVLYDAEDFLDANKDTVPDDLVAVFDSRTCDFGFATHLFGAELKVLSGRGGACGGVFRASPTAAVGGGSSLTQDFHTRLDNLLRTLVHARPHFVRCLRANDTEQPMLFDRPTVAKQVRALQVLETAQLMAGGFPHRMRFRVFAARYRALLPRSCRWAGREAGEGEAAGGAGAPPARGEAGARGGAGAAPARGEAAWCGAVLVSARAAATAHAHPAPPAPHAAHSWAIGTRHVFLTEGMRQVLERIRRARRSSAASRIQWWWRARRCPPSAAPAPPAPARPRPAPIAGTPPPEPKDKCEVVKKTCSMFGLDLERPPPLPPSRAYTVSGGVKLGFPQQRRVVAEWSGEGATLRAGDTVLAVRARAGRVLVQVNGVVVSVPHSVLSPARAPPPRLPPPPPAPLAPPPLAPLAPPPLAPLAPALAAGGNTTADNA